MSRGGSRRRALAGTILAGIFGIGAAACSSGPSAAAKGLCGSLVATLPPNAGIAVSIKTVEAGEDSGDPSLDHGATALVKGLHDHSTAAISKANAQIVAACDHAGIPLGTFNP
jgi:hypothetical protein